MSRAAGYLAIIALILVIGCLPANAVEPINPGSPRARRLGLMDEATTVFLSAMKEANRHPPDPPILFRLLEDLDILIRAIEESQPHNPHLEYFTECLLEAEARIENIYIGSWQPAPPNGGWQVSPTAPPLADDPPSSPERE